MLEGEVVIGLSVEQGIQPLKNGKLLFFQMTDHHRNELLADFPELDAPAAAWPMPKDFGRDQPKPLGDWFDRRVLPGEETGQIAFTSGADEREDDILLECIVVQELIEKADQLVQLLPFLVITWIRRSVASFGRDPVLELAHRYQNAEVRSSCRTSPNNVKPAMLSWCFQQRRFFLFAVQRAITATHKGSPAGSLAVMKD